MNENSQNLPEVSEKVILQCFSYLHDANSTPQVRKQADKYLLELQKNVIQLLPALMSIFEQNHSAQLRLQALIYISNVIKRNWTQRKNNKAHSQFDLVKKSIRIKLLNYLCQREKAFLNVQFDILKFLCKLDFPHAYSDFTNFVIKCLSGIELNQTYVLIFKQLKEIFEELATRKNFIPRKYFEDLLREILNQVCIMSQQLKQMIEKQFENNIVNSLTIKLSKYSDQIIASILRLSPIDILDDQIIPDIMKFLLTKLQFLLNIHKLANHKSLKQVLEKNIKSLILDLGLIQASKPLILSWIVKDFYDVLLYVVTNHNQFVKSATLRYSMLSLRRILREFAFYSDDATFSASIKSKATSMNFMELRRVCHQFYYENINENTVEGLMNFLISDVMSKYAKEQHAYFDFQQNSAYEKGNEKELTAEACTIILIEVILERFTIYTSNLIKNLILSSISCQWTNINSQVQSNLFSILAILPATCKKNHNYCLADIPVLDILNYIYSSQSLKIKFSGIVSGWIDAFSNEQLRSLTDVLLNFIETEESIQANSMQILMGCCQCLNKIIMQRFLAIDLNTTIQRIMPVSISVFQKTDNPEILWPMINLISNIIMKVEFNTQILIDSIHHHKLSQLISNKSPVLIEALCEMFKGFLCVIPRNVPAKTVYEVICHFLNNHLSQFDEVNHQKIFKLWYIAIREYSSSQNCDKQYFQLFENHFKKNLFRKSCTLIYILEEYLLSGLISSDIPSFIQTIYDCYIEAEDLEREEKEQLKISALSFEITLITKYTLEETYSQGMFFLILKDFCNFDVNATSSTLHNSLLAIINRYIILYKMQFFQFLVRSNSLSVEHFFNAYFQNMQCLTSRTAMYSFIHHRKINAIALLTLFNLIDTDLFFNRIQLVFKMIIPEIQFYVATLQNNGENNFTGKIENSPTLRFSSNILSERKEEIRKKGCFDSLNLLQYFREEIHKFMIKKGYSISDLASSFADESWGLRFSRIF